MRVQLLFPRYLQAVKFWLLSLMVLTFLKLNSPNSWLFLREQVQTLEYAVKAELGCKVRSIELNLPQRCGAHIASATDLAESVNVGRAAVKAASEGVTREMMVIVRDSTEPYAYHVDHSDVSKIANQIKAVPAEFINERGNNVTDECARYLLPLIAGEAGPKYKNGIPDYLIIE